MRDLTTTELGFVYGANGCGKPAPKCGGSKGTRTKGNGTRSNACGTRGRGTKTHSKGTKSKGRCGC